MDMDNSELEEYLNSQDAVAAAFNLNNTGTSSLQQQQMLNGDIEAMVAENERELRRQSIASAYGNAVGPDYLDMSAAGDPSGYTSMVSPTSIVSPDTFTMSPGVSQMGMTAEMNSALMEAAGNAAGDSVTQPMNMFNSMHAVSNSSMMMTASTSMAMSPIVQTSMQQAIQMQNQASFMQGRFGLFPFPEDGGIADGQEGMLPDYQGQTMDTVMKSEPPSQRYVDIYSSSGFDMIEILVSCQFLIMV